MAAELPYLTSYKNVGVLFDRIAAAKAPETFSTTYLTGTIGLKSTADRQLIPMLKAMGFLDPNGKPLPQYALLKNSALAPGAIAAGIRRAYAPLFDSNALKPPVIGQRYPLSEVVQAYSSVASGKGGKTVFVMA